MTWLPIKKLEPVVANDPVRASFDAIRADNDPDAVIKADAVASAAVTLVDKEPDAVTRAEAVTSVAVVLVENEPDAKINADEVDSVNVIRDANEDESLDTVDICDISVPFNDIEPVNMGLCISIYYVVLI